MDEEIAVVNRGGYMQEAKYKRILLKLSGEVLQGDQEFGISQQTLSFIAGELSKAANTGVEMAIVVGGGNILRGASPGGLRIERSRADAVGMLGTMINALLLREELEQQGNKVAVLSAVGVERMVDSFEREKALRLLDEGYIVILAAGTGLPYFSTDTAAAIRALELNTDILLKGTKVDGVYDRDPALEKKAARFDTISYGEVLSRGLAFMDTEAVSLCRRMGLPVFVFRLMVEGNIRRAVLGEAVGTIVREESRNA